MRDRAMKSLPRMLLTFLLALGLTLSFLGALNLEGAGGRAALFCVLTAAALEGISWTKRTAMFGGIGLAAAFLLWLIGGGGSTLSDLARALTLQFSGVPGALPLMRAEAAAAFAVLFTLISFFCSRPGESGALPLMLTIGAVMLLWLSDRPGLMICLLPAAIASVTLILAGRPGEANVNRVLPWAAGLILLGFLITPKDGIEIPALREKMDSMRQAVMDRLFFTEPRDVFSLATEGYYPQGVSQLGGPAHPSDHAVMQVSTPRAAYLRGVLMNEYDGRSWRNTLGGRRYLWDAGGVSSQRAALFDQNLPESGLSSSLTAASEVSVRMLREGASTLFVPQRVRELRAGGELVPYFTNSSELFVTRNLQEGDTWSVSAPLFLAGDPGLGTLVDAAAGTMDPQWESVRETYTALPSHLEEPVWQMAADITANLNSEYDKAFAIQSYLSRNYRYTLEPEAQPSNLDFVTNFLFNTREGYCTYFASAMTVLCRMAGLPARYVEGYLAEPNAQGQAIVTGMNAHAWTEVYFRGFGWLTFDATPHRAGVGEGESTPTEAPTETPSAEWTPTPAPPPNAETATPAPQPQSDPTPETPIDEGTPIDEDGGEPGGFPWMAALTGLLAMIAALLGTRWIQTSPRRKEKKTTDEAVRFDIWMNDALRRLDAAGHTRLPGETLMGFTRRLDGEGGLPASLSRLGECASLLRYGKVTALETDTALAREAAETLRKELPLKFKARYAIHRLRPGDSRIFHLSGKKNHLIIKIPNSGKAEDQHDSSGKL